MGEQFMDKATFTNDVILEEALPNVDDLDFEGLAESYPRNLRIETIGFLTIIFMINMVVNFFIGRLGWLFGEWWFYALYFGLALLMFMLAPIIARSRGFAIREKDIHYKSGVIWKKTVSLPFNRIQHVGLESGPVERFFKLTTLKFFSAGGSKADMKIPALTFERSKRLREFVINKAGIEEEIKTKA